MRRFVVGLTGGIGSGKSAASEYLAQKNVTVVDADVIARVVVEPGQPALDAIAAAFGAHLIMEDGNLNRRALREVVFHDSACLKQLEAITHPAIELEIKRRIQAATSEYVLLVSPLLLETQQHKMADRILLIDVPEALQIARASQRDNANVDQIRAIIRQQMPRSDKQKRADDIVVNDATLQALHEQLDQLHQEYTNQAKAL